MTTESIAATPAADDLSAGYMAHRTDLIAATAGEELMARVLQRRKLKPAAEPVAAAPGAEDAAPDRELQALEETKTVAKTGGLLAGAAAVGRDVFRGLIETPRAIFKGTRNAAQETIDLAESASGWLDARLPLGGVHIGTDGLDFLSSRELRDARSALEIELPDIKDPQSVTGQVVRGVSQFLAGFAGAGKLKALQAMQPLTRGGRWGKAVLQGAVADFTVFDEHETRLSDLVEQVPALQNPVTEYLASDPSDSVAEGRFKLAVEGMLGGTLAEGLIRGLSVIRKARQARGQPSLTQAEQTTHETEVDAFAGWGTATDAPLLYERPSTARVWTQKIADAAREAVGMPKELRLVHQTEPEVMINFARIDAPEDVRTVMQAMADRHRTAIDEGRRGAQTFGEIRLNAEQENAWGLLLERRVGQPLNAEQSVAARTLWVTTSQRLAETAATAATHPSEANLFLFRKMMTIQNAVQKEVIAARTETARALASWRIPVGSSAEQLRQAQWALEATGGTDVTRELAQRVAALGRAGAAKELDEFVERSAMATTKDAVVEAWIAGMLSGPKTHIANTLSNMSVVAMQVYERAVAARIGHALGDAGGVELGEASAMFFGAVEGIKDGLRYAWKAARTGETGFGIGKVEAPRQGAISSEAFGLSSSGWLGRFVDAVGSAARIPGRALGAEDEFFKTVAYRAELKAQALRQATREVHAGQVAPDKLKERIAEIVQSPPENIRIAAVDQALYSTFTNAPGQLARSLSRVSNEYLAVKILLPFVRTPANIMRYSFERTPLAPLMKQVRADVAAGGARRDLALARMSTGTAIMMAAADMAMSGQVSGGGPVDPAQRQALARTGWQPYSVKLGDRWYSYRRMDHLGMTLGLAADMVELTANSDYESLEGNDEALAVAVAASIGNNVMSKTYLSSVSGFFEAMSDPKRYSEGFAERLAGSLAPAGLAEAARFQDPYMREVAGMLDAMRARTPGLSDDLPARRDLWGRPISYQSGIGAAYDMFSPVYAKKEAAEPIDQAIIQNGINARMPPKSASFDGVTINLRGRPDIYSRYVELAGNELKHPAWGKGAKDLLNAVVSGKHELSQVYAMRSDGPDGGKAAMILDTINQFRAMARQQLLEEYPELRADVASKQEEKRRARMPVVGAQSLAP